MSMPIFSSEFFSSTSNHTRNSNVAFNPSYWEHVFTAVLVGLIAVMGFVGNSMIIAAVAFSHKLQTSTNAFVTSLSLADLLTSLFMIWFMVGLLGRYDWPLPKAEWLCTATGFVLFTCIGISIYNLAAISVNRLILIIKPHTYRRIFTSWKLGLLVALPWLCMFSMTTIFILTDITGFGYDKSELGCGDLDLHKNADNYNLAQTLICLPVPLVTIDLCVPEETFWETESSSCCSSEQKKVRQFKYLIRILRLGFLLDRM